MGCFSALIKVVQCLTTKEELPEMIARRQAKRLRSAGTEESRFKAGSKSKILRAGFSNFCAVTPIIERSSNFELASM